MIGGRFRNRRQYRVIHEFFKGTDIDYKLYSIHHKDFDNQNDNIDNLELMATEEHRKLHSDRIKGKNNPYYKFSDKQKFDFASHPGEKNPKYSDRKKIISDKAKIILDSDLLVILKIRLLIIIKLLKLNFMDMKMFII